MGVWYDSRLKKFGVDFHPTRATRRIRRLIGTRAEAEAVLASLVVEHRSHRYAVLAPPIREITFAALAARFLAEHPGSRRSNHYPKCVARLLRLMDATQPVRAITRADIDRLRNRLLIESSASTAIKTLHTLGRMMKLAVRWGLLDASPAADLEMPPTDRRRVRFLTLEEYRRLEVAAPEWLRPVLRVAVTTGLRLKEISLLNPDAIDWSAGLLHVAEATKTGHRVVPLGVVAEGAVRAVLASERPLGTDTARRSISEGTRRAMRRAGIEGASFHTLRHTAASWMVQAGVPLLEVQRVLGHSSPAMSGRYTHLQPGHLRPAIAALDSKLRGSAVGGTASGSDLARNGDSAETRVPPSLNPESLHPQPAKDAGVERPPTRLFAARSLSNPDSPRRPAFDKVRHRW